MPLVALLGVAAWVVLVLLWLTRADTDLLLLWHTRLPADAYRNKVVWITGASQGFGEALALEYASRGAYLILSSRKRHALEAVKAKCVGAAAVEVLPFDLTGGEEALKEAVAQAEAMFGGAGVDYMVHNAGASQHCLAEECSDASLRGVFEINALAPIALSRHLLPRWMQRGRGRFVVVASMAGVVPSPGQAAYSGAKAALINYFNSVATEVADTGVGCTVCCLGPVKSTGQQRRSVWGPNGMVPEKATPGKGSGGSRVAPARAAQLVAAAGYHGLDRAWIAKLPVLPMGYMMQYAPWAGMAILKLVGPGRARKVKGEGASYDTKGLLMTGIRSRWSWLGRGRRAGPSSGKRE